MAVSKRLRYEIFRRDGYTCHYCGRSAPDTVITTDHVIPTALGGPDTPENLVTACLDCNAGKTSTSPDGPVVADVSEDALRWAEAMRDAAQEQQQNSQQRAQTHKTFVQAWKKRGGGPLPDGWRGSIDSLIAAGLPTELITECVDIAADRTDVPARNRFKYMCGIGWRKVDQLRARAQEIVRTSDTSEPEDFDLPETVLDACAQMFDDAFDSSEIEAHLDRARSTEGAGISETALYYRALSSAIDELVQDRAMLEMDIRKVMDLYSEAAVGQAMDASFQTHRDRMGDDFTRAGVLSYALDLLTEPARARKTLNGLPDQERTRWLQAAQEALSDEAHSRDLEVVAVRLLREAQRPDPDGEPPF